MLPKVMIVEDDAVIREIYALKFELEGYPVLAVENGERALAAVAGFAPHYILLDMMMPVMGGLEFMERYRMRPDAAEVIVFSNISASHQVAAIMKLGAAAYWVKSDYTPQQVVENIAKRWRTRHHKPRPSHSG
jgi:CheY-like chemotaxis protein